MNIGPFRGKDGGLRSSYIPMKVGLSLNPMNMGWWGRGGVGAGQRGRGQDGRVVKLIKILHKLLVCSHL
jgi:hypothetical protein